MERLWKIIWQGNENPTLTETEAGMPTAKKVSGIGRLSQCCDTDGVELIAENMIGSWLEGIQALVDLFRNAIDVSSSGHASLSKLL